MRYIKADKNKLTFSDLNTDIDISLKNGWNTDMINNQYAYLVGESKYSDEMVDVISSSFESNKIGSPTRRLMKKRYSGTPDYIEQ